MRRNLDLKKIIHLLDSLMTGITMPTTTLPGMLLTSVSSWDCASQS